MVCLQAFNLVFFSAFGGAAIALYRVGEYVGCGSIFRLTARCLCLHSDSRVQDHKKENLMVGDLE